MWTRSKRSLLLLVVLFSLSWGFSWAEETVTLTMDQWTTLKTELTNLKRQIETADSELTKSKEALTEAKQQLTALQTQLTLQSDLLEALSKSSQTLNQELWIDRLTWFGVGVATGFIGGNYTGFKIGIELSM